MKTFKYFRMGRALTLFCLWSSRLVAGSHGMVISHAFNDVTITNSSSTAHAAALQEVVPDDCSIRTGLQSRAEVLLTNGALVRLGAETELRFIPGSHQMLLNRGTLLVQIPEFHHCPPIHAGSLTAAAGNATFLIEHLPGKIVKIAVMNGELRLSVNKFLGDSILLTAGKLLITSPNVTHIPDPVDVDLLTLSKTSSLINPDLFQRDSTASVPPLQSMPGIDKKIARQDGLYHRMILFRTNLVILGSGNNVVIPPAGNSTTPPPPPQNATPPATREIAAPSAEPAPLGQTQPGETVPPGS